MLHLAFHAWVEERVASELNLDLFWSELPLGDEAAAAVAGFCRRIGRRPPHVPYGIVYEGGALGDDGSGIFDGVSVGLTCATYILALLRSFNHEPLALETWRPRQSDDPWHAAIVKMLINLHCRRPDRLTADHIVAVSRERGCARYRPEEVAGAAQAVWPATFEVAEARGREVTAFLLARQAEAPGTTQPG